MVMERQNLNSKAGQPTPGAVETYSGVWSVEVTPVSNFVVVSVKVGEKRIKDKYPSENAKIQAIVEYLTSLKSAIPVPFENPTKPSTPIEIQFKKAEIVLYQQKIHYIRLFANIHYHFEKEKVITAEVIIYPTGKVEWLSGTDKVYYAPYLSNFVIEHCNTHGFFDIDFYQKGVVR